jgi:cell division protein ZapA (FtsZ GTPase activity inhibitor)
MLKRVTIDILGRQYAIKTDGNEEYVQKIADYVNAKSREIMESTQTISTLDVAVKVAINLADELFHERASNETFCKSVEQESRQLVQQILAQLEKPFPSI